MKKIAEKLKVLFKKNDENDFRESLLKAREELRAAESGFNEATDKDYIDIAILNLNLAKRKYELCISEARELYRAS